MNIDIYSPTCNIESLFESFKIWCCNYYNFNWESRIKILKDRIVINNAQIEEWIKNGSENFYYKEEVINLGKAWESLGLIKLEKHVY